MNIDRFRVDGARLEQELLARLLGRVFHVTSASAFERIREDGYIRSNKDGQLSFTFPQSKISYARSIGAVSLSDLRDKSNDQIETSLMKFYFLNPRSHDDPVFLVLSDDAVAKLVVPPRSHKEVEYKLTWVPETEVCYPGDLPLEEIAEVLVPEFFYTREFLAARAEVAAAAEAILQETMRRRNREAKAVSRQRRPNRK